MFSSVYQFFFKRPLQLDDIYSLLCVVYYFIHDTLPWIKHLEELSKASPDRDLFSFGIFRMQRKEHMEKYDNEFKNEPGDLGKLFQLIIEKQRKVYG